MSVLTGQSLERKLATEEAEIAEIVQGFLTLQARAAGQDRPLRRATHAKGVCVRAEFEVFDVTAGRDPALAARLAKGIYARPGIYPATVRFSNSDPNVKPDFKPDVRALSFAVDLVPDGPAAPGANTARQDLSMQSATTLPINDLHAFVVMVKVLTASSPARGLWSLPFRDKLVFARTMMKAQLQTRQPLRPYQQLRYWSNVPFRHGATDVVKYSASPCAGNPARPLQANNPNALQGRTDPAPERRHHDELLRLRASVPRYGEDDLQGQTSGRRLLDRERERRVEGNASAVSHRRAAHAPSRIAALGRRVRGHVHRRDRELDAGQHARRGRQSRTVASGAGEPKGAHGQIVTLVSITG